MSVELSANNPVSINTETILAVQSAKLAKSQSELEGQMALTLISSASVDNVSLPAAGNSGQNINIKV